MVRLRLTARGDDEVSLTTIIDNQVGKLHHILGNDIFADGDLTIAGALGTQLLQRQYTLATAESCTGGNIAHEITA
ncbi:CinA family protein, partial [Salmonella enterica subsp. enterica serovar Enteritidis]|uniref:CinA family protein n=1 Tax=Salmonella enterica TaxID=28901 RepID=UPI0039E76D6A